MLDKIKYKETSTKCAILFVGHTNLKGGIIMLKFQNNDTTIIATFEDFILTTYVIIDELYHRFAPSEVRKRWMQNYLIPKSLRLLSVESWSVLILKMPGFLL